MKNEIKAKLYFWKEIEIVRTAIDVRACQRPCFLFSAALAAKEAGTSTAVLRDGHDENAGAVIDLTAVLSTVDLRNYDPPVHFKRGLFIDVGSNVTSVVVQFIEV